MSDYTPTTEDMRHTYIANCHLSYCNADHEAEFDAWLAEYRNSVIQEVHDEVRLIPCYGPRGGPVEFDIGEDARTQVLEAILELKA